MSSLPSDGVNEDDGGTVENEEEATGPLENGGPELDENEGGGGLVKLGPTGSVGRMPWDSARRRWYASSPDKSTGMGTGGGRVADEELPMPRGR